MITKDKALEEFNKVLQIRGLSQNTIKMYLFYINKYFDYCDKENIEDISLSLSQDYILYLKDTAYSAQTINVIICAIRYFSEGVLGRIYYRRQFPSLIFPYYDPKIFDEDQVRTLIANADVRLKAIILLGVDCGLRRCEVANLRISDIDSKKMILHITNSKRNKSRDVKLSQPTLDALRNYWKVYRSKEYLFERPTESKHISVSYIGQLISRYFKNFPFCEGYSFHSLRHTYATKLLENGCSPFQLKRLLGHSSFASTSRYIHMVNLYEDVPSLADIWGIK